MNDDFTPQALAVLETLAANNVSLSDKGKLAVTDLIVSTIRSAVMSRQVQDYTAATVAAVAEERKRILKICHAVVDNAAGDTHLGQTIIARIERGT
jgi:hypothetical protein